MVSLTSINPPIFAESGLSFEHFCSSSLHQYLPLVYISVLMVLEIFLELSIGLKPEFVIIVFLYIIAH